MKRKEKNSEPSHQGVDFLIMVTFIPSIILTIIKLEWGLDISWFVVFLPFILILSLTILVPLVLEALDFIKSKLNKSK